MRGLGAPEASGVHLVFDRWSEVVGEALAARTRPLRMDGGRLVLAVDEPAIATHVRFLQGGAAGPARGPPRARSRDRARPPRRAQEVAAKPARRDGRVVTPRLVDFQGCDSGL